MLLEYVSGGQVAIITFNRPQANNAFTTAMAVLLRGFLEEIAARVSVRVAILTGAENEAFCVGGGLRERKDMTKEQWLRQHAEFDRTIYTLRQGRRPIFAAVNGLAQAVKYAAKVGQRPPPGAGDVDHVGGPLGYRRPSGPRRRHPGLERASRAGFPGPRPLIAAPPRRHGRMTS
jgi:hypothetical protein